MDSSERVALVNRMVGLVNQLYLLETCCPQLSCDSRTAKNNFAIQNRQQTLSSKCFIVKSRPHACQTNLNDESDIFCKKVPQNRPRYKPYNCGVTQTKSTPSINKFNTRNSYKQQQPEKYCCTSKPKPNMSTLYRTNKKNNGPAPKYNPQASKPCCMLKPKPLGCLPNNDPVITWTPVLEIRKTTNAKNLERQNDYPMTKFVYVEPPGCPYQPVWSTKDPMCEGHCEQPDCPALGPPPGYNGDPIELCCPGGKGPPVDRWGQPYECKQTVDGRAVCVPTKEAGPTDWCDAITTPFKKCDTMKESRRILTRGKVLNQRFRTIVGNDAPNSNRRSSYKKPVWPRMAACNDGRCCCPKNPSH